MARASIPVYDISSISKNNNPEQHLLAERLGDYVHKHYTHLHRPHRHSFYHLVLFTEGSGSHTIDFVRFKVKPYQAYFMTPGQVHGWDFKGDIQGYIVHFSQSFFTPFLQNEHYIDRFNFFRGISEESVCQLPATIHEKVTGLFESILTELRSDHTYALDMIRMRLLELFITVDENCRKNGNQQLPQHKNQMLQRLLSLIDTHYIKMRLPKEYADLMNITANHLNAFVQDMLGKTAGEVIRDRVLLEAKRLLTNADMTIAEIGYYLNFKDNAYFNRFFKKYTGQTPETFRKHFIQL